MNREQLDYRSSTLPIELYRLITGTWNGKRATIAKPQSLPHCILTASYACQHGTPERIRTFICEFRRLVLLQLGYRGIMLEPSERFELPSSGFVVRCSISAELRGLLAGQEGFKPPIYGFGVRCIRQLCYCPATIKKRSAISVLHFFFLQRYKSFP